MTTADDISQIKQILLADYMNKTGPSKPQVMGSVELNLANPSLTLNSNYYYDITLKLKQGSPAITSIIAYVQLVTEQTPDPSPMFLDSSNVQWKIRGIHCNHVYIDPTAIGNAHIVVGYIGYDSPEAISLSI